MGNMDTKLNFIDVTLRDAHQSLWSTRMTTEMMTPILSRIDQAGYSYVNILGGAVFDVCVRYLQENPWERIRVICDQMKHTPVDALTRGQSLYTFELFPDDIVALNAQRLAANGVSNLTVYDALNDHRNLTVSVSSAHDAGMTVTALMVYTVSPVHTDYYYRERAQELLKLGADRIGIKDPTGLLTPERAQTLFPAVKKVAGDTPIELHSHCQSGLAPDVYIEAIKAGITYLHTATTPLAHGASLPPIEFIEKKARQNGCQTGVDLEQLEDISAYFKWIAYRENKPLGEPKQYDPTLYEHQVPGGMISNLKSQLKDMNMEDRLNDILDEASQVRQDLGYPILVSPFAQYVITQAVLNVTQGERYKTVPDEIRKYVLGHYGRLAAPPSEDFLERADIDLQEARTERAGDYIRAGIPKLRQKHGSVDDEKLLLAAFFEEGLVNSLKPPKKYSFYTSPIVELVRYLDKYADGSSTSITIGDLKLKMKS